MKFTPDTQPDLEYAPDEVREAEKVVQQGYRVTTMGHPKEEGFQGLPTPKIRDSGAADVRGGPLRLPRGCRSVGAPSQQAAPLGLEAALSDGWPPDADGL